MPSHASVLDDETPNGFDCLRIDVRQLFATHPLTQKDPKRGLWGTPFEPCYSTPLAPVRFRRMLWSLLRRTKLDQSWFTRFRRYWSKVLGGRPLWGVEDFYFLRNVYRMRFQRTGGLPADASAATHLEVWQDPAVLCHLFHSVYKEELFHCLHALELLSLARRPVRRALEFGCGAAPICTSFFEFHRTRKIDFFLADIEAVSFHYAAWKFGEFPNVFPVALTPENEFSLDLPEPLDAIFCLAVFEHLNRPIDTVAAFHRLLAPGGVLIFDYIISEAQGLDTAQGLRERSAVMRYLRENFQVLHGRLDEEKSIGLTVVTPK
jgi:hypothetical protein